MQPVIFDAIVLGGGPAGSAAAITLREAGRSVALVEATRYDKPRIGETLPPDVRLPLAELDALDDLRGHLPSVGHVAAWESAEARWNDFIFQPYGYGWHVDRRLFDYSLARRAERKGALLMMSCRATACQYRNETWHVTLTGSTTSILARWLVCATGRGASPLRRQMGRPVQHDQLIASYYRGKREPDWACGDRAVIEAVPDGWWYSAPLPDGLGIFAFFSSPRNTLNRRSWHRAMEAAHITRERFRAMGPSASIGVTAASSWQSPVVAGREWVACGDAAVTRDPLSSQGVYSALTAGISAARSLLSDGSQEDYVKSIEDAYLQYLSHRKSYYSQVNRFSGEQFWRERLGSGSTVH